MEISKMFVYPEEKKKGITPICLKLTKEDLERIKDASSYEFEYPEEISGDAFETMFGLVNAIVAEVEK